MSTPLTEQPLTGNDAVVLDESILDYEVVCETQDLVTGEPCCTSPAVVRVRTECPRAHTVYANLCLQDAELLTRQTFQCGRCVPARSVLRVLSSIPL